MRVLEGNADDLDPLRRRLRAVDRRDRRRQRGGDSLRLVLLRRRGRVAGRRRRRTPLRGGERVWWDYRDWSATTTSRRSSAPGRRPFAGGYEGHDHPVVRRMHGGAGAACGTVEARLERRRSVKLAAPGDAGRRDPGPGRPLGAAAIRPGRRRRSISGPQSSGVFADFDQARGRGASWSGSMRAATPARRFGARRGPGCGDPALRRRAGLDRDRRRRRRRRGRRRAARRGARCETITRSSTEGGEDDAVAAGIVIKSPFAYTPRPGPLQSASPGAAVAYLGSLVAVAFLYSNPIVLAAAGVAAVTAGLLAGAPRAVRAALWMGLTLALLIVVVNAIAVSRGETVLARLGDWPMLRPGRRHRRGVVDGRDARPQGAGRARRLRRLLGLRRSRPGAAGAAAARRPLGADRDPGLPPGPGRGGRRLPPARRGPAARARAPPRSGRAPLARRLLAGSLDRAVDVAATLELRGYGLGSPRVATTRTGSRHDRRFYAFAAAVLAARDRRPGRRRRRLRRLPDGEPRCRRRDHRPRSLIALTRPRSAGRRGSRCGADSRPRRRRRP